MPFLRRLTWSLCLLLTCGVAAAQATFHADTRYLDGPERNSHVARVLAEMEWRIEGQRLRWGGRVTVPVDPGIDTVFFRQRATSDWDTLLCDISRPDSFAFEYNACCGGFNVHRMGDRRYLQGSCTVRLLHPQAGRRYLAVFDEAGMELASGQNDTIFPVCRSAMAPNVYLVRLMEIGPFEAGDSCCGTMCQYRDGGMDAEYGMSYAVRERHAEFLWMPLSSETLRLTYDVRRRRLSLE